MGNQSLFAGNSWWICFSQLDRNQERVRKGNCQSALVCNFLSYSAVAVSPANLEDYSRSCHKELQTRSNHKLPLSLSLSFLLTVQLKHIRPGKSNLLGAGSQWINLHVSHCVVRPTNFLRMEEWSLSTSIVLITWFVHLYYEGMWAFQRNFKTWTNILIHSSSKKPPRCQHWSFPFPLMLIVEGTTRCAIGL